MVCENNTGSLIFLNIHINILISTYIYFDIDVKVISNPETLTKIDKTSCNFCKEKVSLLFFYRFVCSFFSVVLSLWYVVYKSYFAKPFL